MATLHLFIADLAFAAVTAAVLGLSTVAFTVQYSVSNVFNLAYGELLTFSAYTAYTCVNYLHMNVWLAGLVAVMATGVVALILNHALIAPFVRKRAGEFTVLVVTFALGVAFNHLLVAIYGPESFSLGFGGNANAIHVGDFALSYSQLVTILLAIGAMVLLQFILTRTMFGKAMRAIVDNRVLARASGIRTAVVTDLAWFISGCLSGIAGLALVISTGTVNNLVGANFLLFVIPAAFLGGMGSIYGAMLGAVLIAFASDWSSILFGSEFKVVFGLVVLLIVFVLRPSGIIAVPLRRWDPGS